MNEVQENGGIDDINASYNTRIEGCTTRMPDMKGFGEIEMDLRVTWTHTISNDAS